MRKLGIFGLVLVMGLLVAASTGFAATRTVCAAGCGYATITAAVIAASDGDVIAVKPGTYIESIAVGKSVRIVSTEGKHKTFVQAPPAADYGFQVVIPKVVIRGFTIRGNTDKYGVIVDSNAVRIEYCTVEKSMVGIMVNEGASEVTLANNQVRYNTAMAGGYIAGTGILVYAPNGLDIPNVVIVYNQINDNDNSGIMVLGVFGTPSFNGMRISYNTLVNNGSWDLSGPSNNNTSGIYFEKASGTVTMNYNKFLATSPPGGELGVAGATTPTFTGTGNVIYPNFRDSMAGIGKTLVLP